MSAEDYIPDPPRVDAVRDDRATYHKATASADPVSGLDTHRTGVARVDDGRFACRASTATVSAISARCHLWIDAGADADVDKCQGISK